MKYLLAYLLFCSGSLFAGEHIVDDLKVSLTVPDDWKYDPDSSFGYTIIAPGKSRGLRIHTKSPSDKDLVSALNTMIQNFEWNSTHPTKNPISSQRVIAVEAVKDSQGKEGFRVTTGLIGGEDRNHKVLYPNVYHYLFINSDMRPICICLYTSSGITESEEADQMILTSLKIR
ncbi:MAG: hypothetical protein AAF571_14075 [Verrucomicrobiota bacterium]